MKIEFVRSGGFAGIRLARTFDTTGLPAPQAQKLEDLVKGVGFFELSDIAPPSRKIPDSIEYRVTITSAERSRAITVTEANMPEQLRPLLDYLTSLAKLGDDA